MRKNQSRNINKSTAFVPSRFLPMTRQEMQERGWAELDILLVSGDAYVDHPSFGVPLLGRLLEKQGYRVGIVAQPRWDNAEDISCMGRPRLFCGISAGCLDSMLCHYTAFRKKRHDDSYTPGGKAGARPNRASIVYSNLVRAAFPGIFILLGGIEASLRRLAHYDFWSDSLRRSLLFDSKADLISYGMGEYSISEVAKRLHNGQPTAGIPGTVRISDSPEGAQLLPSYEEILVDKQKLIRATQSMESAMHAGTPALAQQHGRKYIFCEVPAPLPSQEQLDAIYELPFTRQSHPRYREVIPALDMVKWSITAMRGCGGGCSFCSLALHQSRHLCSRSSESMQNEVQELTRMPGWKGMVSDVGGPTANLWGSSCKINGKGCRRESCLFPDCCPQLELRQGDYLDLLRAMKRLPGVQKVGIGSGIRFDLALKDPRFLDGLVGEFVSGQLKLAPEHSVNEVLTLMRKTDFRLFEKFVQQFSELCRAHQKEQYIIPYVMSAFPGCTMEDMQALAAWFRSRGWKPQQAQCFVPTPGTMATAMYYAECDSQGKPIHVAKTDREREDQHAVLYDRSQPEKNAPGKSGMIRRRGRGTGNPGSRPRL